MTEATKSAGRTRAILLTASGGAFLSMLDSTVANLAIPDLQRAFPTVSVSSMSWVISAYAVMFAALLAPSGRLADVLGRRALFAGGVGLFTVASLACAVAPNLPFLIVARLVQGAGAAAMIPASLTILLLDGPADKRAQSIGLWSAASALAAAVGPTVGGVLVDLFGWRSVFYINLPFGVLLVIATLRLLAPQDKSSRGALPDPLGTLLLALGVGALTMGVTEGGTWGWTDAKTLACLVGGVLVLAFVVLRSRLHPVPALETALWGNKTFVATNATSLFYGMAQYPWLLVGVLYIIDVWQYSPLQAGLAMTPGAIVASIAALRMGKVAPKIGGPRMVTLLGLGAFLACGIWFSFGLTDSAAFLALWLPGGFLVGFAMGSATLGTSQSAAMSAPPTRFASSSGLNTTARQFGGALGIAMCAVILQSKTAADGSLGVDAYSAVYLACTVLVAISFLIALFWLRFPPPAAPAPAATPATPAAAPKADSAGAKEPAAAE
ncbi:DHA2 family efflux MFS transporter permease subunit [Actinokineospora spheciospongiae]|uniref:DHA2 family efflux MFS transporter permease subunit n=1 Tax=Actinokineospora spheciospongiae TaxID=909613 RepID=UPI000D71B161|nr:DHA2 family efflux MFS transporter permease subunit [Actinokineospora spheciospongiae]PWW62477.1 EmrB/QacA subfamily drug resistance transporter [Actinokineospora spheciospongiae]